jgi:hypothetical protein
MRKMFLLSVIFLATIFVYTGYYAYAMKMPIDGLQVTLVEYHVSLWGYSAFNETHNITGIYFKFTIHNPTNVQTPPFEVDMSSIYVNGKELDPLTFTSGMAESSGHYFPISQPMTLKPNETYTYDSNNTEPMQLELQTTRVFGGNFTSMWPTISHGNLTLTFSGLLVSRVPGFSGDYLFTESNDLNLYGASEPMGLDFVFLPLNLAVSPFTASSSYT